MRSPRDLAPLLRPRSIAVLGASVDPLKVGGRPVAYLQRMGFAGRIVPINPRRDHIAGLACAPSIADAGEIDLAIVAAPSEGRIEFVREAIEAGVKAIILFSAGFGEVNAEGETLQQEAADLATRAGALLLGPNCLGAISVPDALAATFSTALEQRLPTPGPLSFVGQSGALGAYWLEKVADAGLGVARWLSTGNEAQITIADAFAFFADDAHTQCVCAYVEDIKQRELFTAAAQRMRHAGKPIIAIKSGRSPAGARAAAAHTGAQADAQAYRTIFEQAGIIEVASLTEMIDTARIALAETPAHGRRLGVVTVSGGAGVLICDAAAEAGFDVPTLGAELQAHLRGMVPGFASTANPVDVTGAVLSNTSLMPSVLMTMARSDECDSLFIFLGSMSSIADNLIQAVASARAAVPDKPIVLVWMGAPGAARAAIEGLGVPTFDEIRPAVDAMARLRRP